MGARVGKSQDQAGSCRATCIRINLDGSIDDGYDGRTLKILPRASRFMGLLHLSRMATGEVWICVKNASVASGKPPVILAVDKLSATCYPHLCLKKAM